MIKMKQFVLEVVLLAIIAPSTPCAASAAGFNQFIGFGDSTLDTGYFRYHTTGNSLVDQLLVTAIANGATGGWAGNGVMNTAILAGKFGLSAAPVGGGGTNYANGGATTVPNSQPVLPANVTTIQQIQNYLFSVNGVANPNGLYLIKTGDNDATYYTNQGPAFIAAHPNYLSDGASALAVEVASLQAAGARTIVVRNSYDSALFAGLGGTIPSSNAAAYARTVALGTSEWSSLAAAGVHFIPDDNDSLFRFVVQNPTLFGFTASSVPAANAPASASSALIAILTPAQQQTFLFIDSKHLTTAGQTIEADYTYSLLIAPSQISLLAESAVQGGLASAATIQGQIELSAQHRGPGGINVWASAGANALNFHNASGFSDSSGIPFGGTVGVDYRTPGGFIVGAAFMSGGQTQDFSTGGHFDQMEEAPSLYAAYKVGPVWVNAVATYGLFQDKIVRPVTLGIFTDQNNSDATGQSLALALRGGGDFRLGQITTGPVAGVVLQQVYVNSFTETGASGVTALSFGSQTRNSLVSRLGWRVLVDVGKWQPFIKAEWDHEWADKDRTVTASLTSVAAPSYTLAAAPIASDWCTSSLGASYKLNSQVTLRGAVSEVFFNPRVTSYGGELGVNVSF
jgi:outer membrane lipase/esterase